MLPTTSNKILMMIIDSYRQKRNKAIYKKKDYPQQIKKNPMLKVKAYQTCINECSKKLLFSQKGFAYDFEFLHAFLSNKKIRFSHTKNGGGGPSLHPPIRNCVLNISPNIRRKSNVKLKLIVAQLKYQTPCLLVL